PTIIGLSPNAVAQDVANRDIVVTGSGLRAGATLTVGGAGITVGPPTVLSDTQLKVTVSVAASAPGGPRDVRVTSRDGGTAVCTGCFTVTSAPQAPGQAAAGPMITGLNPSTIGQGAFNLEITVSGTGFAAGATVGIGGAGITIVGSP